MSCKILWFNEQIPVKMEILGGFGPGWKWLTQGIKTDLSEHDHCIYKVKYVFGFDYISPLCAMQL